MTKKYISGFMLISLIFFSGCKISGRIADNGAGINGVKVELAGNVPMSVYTNDEGYYEFSNILIVDRAYTVTPSSDVYKFDPISRDVKVGYGNIKNVDFKIVKGVIETYRKRININPGSSAGTDYQIKIRVGQSPGSDGYDVQLDNKCQPDFDDIRFTADDGATLLSHWRESISGTTPDSTATFWVKINADLNSAQSIYIYYGNAKTSSGSNGKDTFDFYDDFEKPFTTSGGVLENADTWQATPTYEGSGQTTHPDIVYIPDGWNGYKYWMVITPYAGSNDQVENPSILASNNGSTWSVPSGLSNPLIGPPPCDHNCDADIIYNTDTNEMWVYYVDTRRASRCGNYVGQPYHNHNYLKLFKSSDGIRWTGPATLIDWDLGYDKFYISPAVVQVDSSHFYMWMADTSLNIYVFESGDGINWGVPKAINYAEHAWHLNVSYIPSKNEFWMLTLDNNFPAGNVAWAVSKDGMNWDNFPNRILTPEAGAWDSALYRGCFLYDETSDLLEIWYSAYNSSIWHTGFVNTNYSDMLEMLEMRTVEDWTVYRSGGSFSTSSEQKKRGNLSGKLDQTSTSSHQIIIKDTPGLSNFMAEWDMYDDLDGTAFKNVRINSGNPGNQAGIGLWTGISSGYYSYNNKAYAYTVTSVPRSEGWHKFGIKLSSSSTVDYFIDGINVGSLNNMFDKCLSISVEGYSGGTTIFYVDDIRFRKIASVEPAVNAVEGQEHGIWDLF
jgi:hypothetical protein